MEGADILNEALRKVREGINEQLKTLATNFNDQMNIVQANCRAWFEQIKGYKVFWTQTLRTLQT